MLQTPCEAEAFRNPATPSAGGGWGSEFHPLDYWVESYWQLKHFLFCFVSAKETFSLILFFMTRKPGQETGWALKAGKRAPGLQRWREKRLATVSLGTI